MGLEFQMPTSKHITIQHIWNLGFKVTSDSLEVITTQLLIPKIITVQLYSLTVTRPKFFSFVQILTYSFGLDFSSPPALLCTRQFFFPLS